MKYSDLLQEKKNFVFVGETGSGKTEISLNTACLLRENTNAQVHLFDLDQTKALFRARDAQKEMEAKGVALHYMPQLLDTPIMVNGIVPYLRRADCPCVLDVGGNVNAARMVGCLSAYLNHENTAVIYVLNPYRPWSGSAEDIMETVESICNASHLDQLHFVANPTLGDDTGEACVLEGMRMLEALFPIEKLSAVFVPSTHDPSVFPKNWPEMIPIQRYLMYPWKKGIK